MEPLLARNEVYLTRGEERLARNELYLSTRKNNLDTTGRKTSNCMDTQRKYDEGLSKRELALIKWEETLAKKNKKKKVGGGNKRKRLCQSLSYLRKHLSVCSSVRPSVRPSCF